MINLLVPSTESVKFLIFFGIYIIYIQSSHTFCVQHWKYGRAWGQGYVTIDLYIIDIFFLCILQIFYFKMLPGVDVVTVDVATDSKRCAIVSVQNKTVSSHNIMLLLLLPISLVAFEYLYTDTGIEVILSKPCAVKNTKLHVCINRLFFLFHSDSVQWMISLRMPKVKESTRPWALQLSLL